MTRPKDISFNLLAVVVICLVGCQQATIGIEDRKHPENSHVGDERGFDPLELPQDRIVVPKKYPKRVDIIGRREAPDSISIDSVDSNLFIPLTVRTTVDTLNNQAFRVQLYSSKLFGEARKAVRVAEEIFDQPLYVDYEVPYFKVRVGSFAAREDAERYTQKAKAAGYGNAWVVVVNLNSRQVEPLYEEFPDFFEAIDTLLEPDEQDN